MPRVRSIRATFLAWITLILVVVVAGFGGTLYSLVRQASFAGVDAELEGAAQILAERARRVPGSRPRGPFRGPREWMDDPELRELFREEFGRGAFERGNSRPGRRGERGPGRGARRGPSRSREEMLRRIDLPETVRRRFAEQGESPPYFVLWERHGEVLRRSDGAPELEPPDPPAAEGASIVRQRGKHREVIFALSRGGIVLVGRSVERQLAELDRLLGAVFASGGIVLAIGLLGGWFVAKRAIRPIGAIGRAAESISADNLSERIDVGTTETELGELARVLNRTFDRLQAAFEQQAQFTADASHELRTPVSVILAQTAMARRRDRSADEYREVIEACYTVARRMRELVDGLLTLAKNDSGELQLHRESVDLGRIVSEGVALVEPLAAESGVDIVCGIDSITTGADASRFAQVVGNLLSNAIRYTPAGGRVRVSFGRDGNVAKLTVEDNGIGIPAENVPRIFDRFYRVDSARAAKDGGTGLGLAITKAIVEAHGGSVGCASVEGRGTTFEVRLPIVGGEFEDASIAPPSKNARAV